MSEASEHRPADAAELARLRDEVLRALAYLGGAVAALSARIERLERQETRRQERSA